jgi:hypothetical protein
MNIRHSGIMFFCENSIACVYYYGEHDIDMEEIEFQATLGGLMAMIIFLIVTPLIINLYL